MLLAISAEASLQTDASVDSAEHFLRFFNGICFWSDGSENVSVRKKQELIAIVQRKRAVVEGDDRTSLLLRHPYGSTGRACSRSREQSC